MLATRPIDIHDVTELREYTADHPMVRWDVSAESFMQAWAWETAAAWTATGSRGLSVYVIGEQVDAGHLARVVLAGEVGRPPTDVASVSLPRGTLEKVQLPVGAGDDWDWYSIQTLPRPRPGESHAVDLDLADPMVRAELDDLVRISSPRASALPGDDRVRRWMGIRDARDGELIACAAHAEHIPGVPI